jgi:hypothetical protein
VLPVGKVDVGGLSAKNLPFLTVDDEDNFAGLRVKDLRTCITAALGNSKIDGTRLLVRDETCKDRVSLGITGATPKLEVRDGQEKLVMPSQNKQISHVNRLSQ